MRRRRQQELGSERDAERHNNISQWGVSMSWLLLIREQRKCTVTAAGSYSMNVSQTYSPATHESTNHLCPTHHIAIGNSIEQDLAPSITMKYRYSENFRIQDIITANITNTAGVRAVG